MRTFILFLVVSVLNCPQCSAQYNILSSSGISLIQLHSFTESGPYYYCITPTTGVQSAPLAIQFNLVKIDKISNQIIATQAIYGDTMQADSILKNDGQFLIIRNGKIHLLYNKIYFPPMAAPVTYTRYMQLDTNLNITIPEKYLNTPELIQNFTSLNGNRLLYSYWTQFDTSNFFYSKYAILDSAGNPLTEDTFEVKPDASALTDHYVVEVIPYLNNQFLATGFILPNYQRGFYLADSNMQLIDTFYLKPDVLPYSGGYGRIKYFPNIVTLPSGSLIAGGLMETSLSGGSFYTILTKHNPASRFSTQSINVYAAVDSNDYYHHTWPAKENLIYNSYDNRIYFSDVTNKSAMPGTCGTNYNYIQIISADTNLNTLWRKFIYVGPDSCASVSKVGLPDGRSGVLISGYSLKVPFDSNVHFFAYYLDSTGALSGVSTPESAVRERLKVFPNPANNTVYIDDVFNKLSKATIYNATGRLLFDKTLFGESAVINIEDFPPGLYMVKVATKDGEQQSFKIFKK